MKTNWQSSALLAAILGLALPAAAQTSEDTSPGTGQQGQSETGVGIPSTAPVGNRTLEPLKRPGTEMAKPPSAYGGTGAGSDSESMETHLGHKAPGKKLASGLAALHAANQSEIQAGRLAERSAASDAVRSFARQMVDDHTENDQQLLSKAGGRVDFAGEAYRSKWAEASASMKDFQGKTGSSFDQAYMAAMVKDHRKDAAEVKTLASLAHREGAQDWAEFLDDTEQTMQSHLSDAEHIRSEIQNTASSNSMSSGSGDTDASGQSE